MNIGRKLTGFDGFIEWSSFFSASTNSPPSSAGPCLFKCETLPERREPAWSTATGLVGIVVAFFCQAASSGTTRSANGLHVHQYP